jgi:hypothetical protein
MHACTHACCHAAKPLPLVVVRYLVANQSLDHSSSHDCQGGTQSGPNQEKCFDDKISTGVASLGCEISFISVEARSGKTTSLSQLEIHCDGLAELPTSWNKNKHMRALPLLLLLLLLLVLPQVMQSRKRGERCIRPPLQKSLPSSFVSHEKNPSKRSIFWYGKCSLSVSTHSTWKASARACRRYRTPLCRIARSTSRDDFFERAEQGSISSQYDRRAWLLCWHNPETGKRVPLLSSQKLNQNWYLDHSNPVDSHSRRAVRDIFCSLSIAPVEWGSMVLADVLLLILQVITWHSSPGATCPLRLACLLQYPKKV